MLWMKLTARPSPSMADSQTVSPPGSASGQGAAFDPSTDAAV